MSLNCARVSTLTGLAAGVALGAALEAQLARARAEDVVALAIPLASCLGARIDDHPGYRIASRNPTDGRRAFAADQLVDEQQLVEQQPRQQE